MSWLAIGLCFIGAFCIVGAYKIAQWPLGLMGVAILIAGVILP
jgi:hypothetical protein